MMKKAITISIVLIACICIGLFIAEEPIYASSKKTNKINHKKHFDNKNEIKEGDIIFQVTQSSQCKAVQAATKSKYSHCGIIFKKEDSYYVFEAIQPVTATPLQEWIKRGKDKHYVIKRLKNANQILSSANIAKMKKIGEQFYGKNYDLTFEWSDDKIYCSELVWKIYKRAINIEVGKLQKLGDFDLNSDIVKQKIRERYGTNIPEKEIVISPVAIFDCELLETVKIN